MSRSVTNCIRWTTLIIGSALLTPSHAFGQTCWRARPRPACQWFWITESGPRVGTQEAFADDRLGSATAVGLMRNRTARSALGATLELTTGSESGTYRLTVMPRYRHWLSSTLAVEVGAGVALLGEGERPAGFKGLSALAALHVAGLVAVVGQVETRQRSGLETQTAGTLGIRFGSYLGPPVAVTSLVVGLLAGGGSS